MAVVKPFAALRYAVPIQSVVAPPYDVISPEERQALAKSDPYNLVHLTLPESKPDDRNPMVRYQHSAALLAEWRREGVLTADPKPAFYAYKQKFACPVSCKSYTRDALFVLLKTEPYENGVVLPHEQTFPKHKEDRLRLLEATQTHLESIYGLYNDPDKTLKAVLDDVEFNPLCSVKTDDGIEHELYACSNPDDTRKISDAFAPHKIWIADGHHRYETAMNYRKEYIQSNEIAPQDYLIIALTSLQDDGLIVLPTHRMVKDISDDKLAQIPALLKDYFTVTEANAAELAEKVRVNGLDGKRALGIATKAKCWLCVMNNPAVMDEVVADEHSSLWKRLDVTVLHSLVMEKLLGLPKGVEAYTRIEAEVFDKVNSGEYKAGFLVNAPTVEETRDIAAAGEKMPQKSTYFYPKLLSGLTMWGFGDPIG